MVVLSRVMNVPGEAPNDPRVPGLHASVFARSVGYVANELVRSLIDPNRAAPRKGEFTIMFTDSTLQAAFNFRYAQ